MRPAGPPTTSTTADTSVSFSAVHGHSERTEDGRRAHDRTPVNAGERPSMRARETPPSWIARDCLKTRAHRLAPECMVSHQITVQVPVVPKPMAWCPRGPRLNWPTRRIPHRSSGQFLQSVELTVVRPQPSAGIRCHGHGYLPPETDGWLDQSVRSVSIPSTAVPATACAHPSTRPVSVAPGGQQHSREVQQLHRLPTTVADPYSSCCRADRTQRPSCRWFRPRGSTEQPLAPGNDHCPSCVWMRSRAMSS